MMNGRRGEANAMDEFFSAAINTTIGFVVFDTMGQVTLSLTDPKNTAHDQSDNGRDYSVDLHKNKARIVIVIVAFK